MPAEQQIMLLGILIGSLSAIGIGFHLAKTYVRTTLSKETKRSLLFDTIARLPMGDFGFNYKNKGYPVIPGIIGLLMFLAGVSSFMYSIVLLFGLSGS